MTINNPLADNSPDHEDQNLVLRARSGDRQALEDLVQRHQAWIYNIAVRMLHHPQDAEDVTQEILIKVLTRLSSFEGRSSFRTWLYRIVVNHVLNMKRGQVEPAFMDFASYGAAIDDTPELELADPKGTSADTDLLVTEAMLSCTSGMLLCLDREQRLTFILGAIFGVSDTVAAEVLEITPDNFRQRLARARRDLRNFMNDKCGLVNQANPCRCAKKTRGFIQAGYVDPENLLFVRERIGEVREAVPKVHEALSTLDEKCAGIFRGHPFYKAPDLGPMLRRLVASPDRDSRAEPGSQDKADNRGKAWRRPVPSQYRRASGESPFGIPKSPFAFNSRVHSPILLALAKFGDVVLSQFAVACVSLYERRHSHERE